MLYKELIDLLNESGKAYDLELIEKAYNLAKNMHEGQFRKTGEAYIAHPIAVAGILGELGMDSVSIVAGLLHDIVEDTEITLEEIEKDFGKETALLVDGVTKLGQISFSSMEQQQAENLRKMLLAMSKDIRVMIIKLCDRLHNMRTAQGWKPQKQRDKAREVMEIYSPIAQRLGMSNIKDELQDISLRILDPIGYNEVQEEIRSSKDPEEFIAKVVTNVKNRLDEYELKDATVLGRVKSTYGVYRKVFVQNRDIGEIYDIYAVRIILNNVTECYNALMLMHDMFRPIPSRFKDYISSPKLNMYQSLHTSVIGRDGIPFEIQIRTWDMHYIAEYGIAAHWKYKQGIKGQDQMEEKVAWVRQLLESQQDSDDDMEILDTIKSDLAPEDVYVFTPKGDVISLPSGATVIDFAYAIHSAVGNKMAGAKVNGKIVSIDYVVTTGEIIEVITGPKDKGPSRDWLNIVTTSEAKSKIRSWFKKERKEENIIEGKTAFDKELRRNLISLTDQQYPEFVLDVAKRQKFHTAEELYGAIGYGGVQLSNVILKAKEEYKKLKAAQEPITLKPIVQKKPKAVNGVIVEGIDNCLIKFSKCCNPLPGDGIVGFITRGFGVSVHKKTCVNAQNRLVDEENINRWVNAYWAEDIKEDFKATLDILTLDNGNSLAQIYSALQDMRVHLYSFNAKETSDKRVSMNVVVSVNSTEHLNNIVAKLKKNKIVISVIRS